MPDVAPDRPDLGNGAVADDPGSLVALGERKPDHARSPARTRCAIRSRTTRATRRSLRDHMQLEPTVTGTPREKPEILMRTLTLGDMMTTNVKTMREDDSLSSADWDMVVSEIRHLPVVDSAGRVIGIVSDRDVLRASARQPVEQISVASVMTREVETCIPTMPAVEAVVQLLRGKRSALLVTDGAGMLLGIVTTTDFVELARRALAGLDITQPHARA